MTQHAVQTEWTKPSGPGDRPRGFLDFWADPLDGRTAALDHPALAGRALPAGCTHRHLLVLFAVSYFVAVVLGSVFQYSADGIATFWPAGGLLLAVLLLERARAWPLVLVIAIICQMAGHMVLLARVDHLDTRILTWFALGDVGNCIEAVVGAVLLRRIIGRSRSRRRVHVVLTIAAIGALVTGALGAGIAAASLALPTATSFWSTWQVWWFSHLVGVLVVTPFVLACAAGDTPAAGGRSAVAATAEGIVVLLGMVIVTALVFGSAPGPARSFLDFPSMVLPFLLWAALRFTPQFTAAALFTVTMLIVWHADRGFGPFVIVGASPYERVLTLQIFLAVVAVSTHLLAASIADHSGAEHDLRAEVAERVRYEQRQQFLMHELDHRVKNNLASVLALMSITRSATPDGSLDVYVSVLSARIHALARTHEALAASRWRGMPLGQIVETTLEPFLGADPNRLVITHERIMIPARACGPLTMTLHELATNAAVHGALSNGEGRVELAWSATADGAITLTWLERGGPAVTAPPSTNMGIPLIRGFIEHELQGSVTFDFHPEGLVCRMQVPGEAMSNASG